ILQRRSFSVCSMRLLPSPYRLHACVRHRKATRRFMQIAVVFCFHFGYAVSLTQITVRGGKMTEIHESNREKAPYYDITTLLDMIEGPNGEACRTIYADFKERFEQAPGSRHNHQYWRGGYVDHVTDAMNIGLSVYEM